MNKPLDRSFNVAVRTIVAQLFPTGFDVGPDAPMTFDTLKAHVAATKRMKVWDGASDHSIYACPHTNQAARAWHDWCHLKGNHPFTPEGEAAVALMHGEHLRIVYGDTAQVAEWCKIIDAEINGQIAYETKFGHFPANQMAFVKHYMTHGAEATLYA